MFGDRTAGADALAGVLQERYAPDDDASMRSPSPIVLGLPRGGVPVAVQIAKRMKWPWDVLIVGKIGAPGQPEFAVGAVGEGGVEIRNETAIGMFDESAFVRIAAQEHQRVAERAEMLRRHGGMVDIRDRPVVIVDDGLATGATMAAAIAVARQRGTR